MSAVLGEPFMPWQSLIGDVAQEFDPVTGRFHYREIWIEVPRQSGKTTFVLVVELDRGITFPLGLPDVAIASGGLTRPQEIVYSAQTGNDARKKLIEDQVEKHLKPSAVWPLINRVNRGVGNETVHLQNGSTIQPLAATEEAGHGRTVDLAVADEAWADITSARDQAFIPAMSTRPWAQLYGLSTAGTEKSVWLKSKVEIGRAIVEEGDPSSTIAYFEWSGGEDDDPADESKWWEFMPALGHTIDLDVVRHARQSLKPAEFNRAYRNIWPTSKDRLIPTETWDAVCDPHLELDDGIVLAVEADPDMSTAAVAAVDAVGRIELVDVVPFGELTEFVVRVAIAQGARVALDAGGPMGVRVHDLELELGEARLIKAGASELVTASGEFYAAVGDGTVRIRTDPRLEKAAESVTKRKIGDRWAWVRTAVTVPLTAASLAFWARRHAPAEKSVEPHIY